MARLFVIFLFISLNGPALAQVHDYWQILSNGETLHTVHRYRGDSLYKRGQLKAAIQAYQLQNQMKYSICRYELARAYARDLQYDSAFRYLHANMQYDHVTNPATDPAFLL